MNKADHTGAAAKHYARGHKLAWSPTRKDLDFYLRNFDAAGDNAGMAAFEAGWFDALDER